MKRFKKPTAKELREYADSIGFKTFDPQAFLDHYDSNGWKVGPNKMKDWQATVRTWKRMEFRFDRRQLQQQQPRMTYRHRENRINYLNRRKQQLMRMPRTPAIERELSAIQIELTKL